MIQSRLTKTIVGRPEYLTVLVYEENGDGFGGVGGDDALVGADKVAAWLCRFDLLSCNLILG